MTAIQRYWSPTDGRIALDSDGFLYSADSLFGPGQTLSTYAEIDDQRVLVLLGEPGIGKTTEVRRAVDEAGSAGHYIDLGEVADAATLRHLIFEAPAIKASCEETDELTLFLDAFDEALEEQRVLSRVLVRLISELPVERVRLRIACRTADWPADLARQVGEVFGMSPGLGNQLKPYELQPFRAADVVAVANAAGTDGDAFLNAVRERQVGPLARVPLTLKFLLSQYGADGTLPTRRADLYRQGCLELCREKNASRVQTRREGELSPEARFTVAERIAAATIISGKSGVRHQGTGADPTAAELAALTGGTETIPASLVAVDSELNVDQDGLRETFATGLFTARGDDVLGFAHHSHAEFLAASFLLRHRFDVRRALNLLAQERSGRQRIVPQLAGVATWLADLDDDFFGWLSVNEPGMALGADLTDMSDEQKAALVESLLARAGEGRSAVDVGQGVVTNLVHTSLAAQLNDALAPGTPQATQDMAIELAGASGNADLHERLADIALDSTVVARTRVRAAYSLWRTAALSIRSRLKPLAVTPNDEDQNDELKGAALLCVWPDALSIDELLGSLKPPKHENLVGAYTLFLHQELVKHLSDDDLVKALKWTAGLGAKHKQEPFADVIDDLLLAAWERDLTEPLLQAIADAVAQFLTQGHGVGAGSYRGSDLEKAISSNPQKRRALVEALAPYLVNGSIDSYDLVFSRSLIERSDLSWLLEHAVQTSDEAEKRAWADLAENVYARGEPYAEEADAVLTACEKDAAVSEVMIGVCGAVELDSPEAKQAREQMKRHREFEEQRAEREQEQAAFLAESPVRLEAALSRVEAGDPDAFMHVEAELERVLDRKAADRIGGDIRAFSAWQATDDQLRDRILDAGASYLSSGTIETGYVSGSAATAYRAARLLIAERGDAGVTSDRLAALAPAMLYMPFNGDEDEAAGNALLKAVWDSAPEDLIQAITAYAEQEAKQHNAVFFMDRLEPIPVGELDDAFCELIAAKKWRAPALATVLEGLLKRGATCASLTAIELVTGRSAGAADDLEVAAASFLLVYSTEEASESAALVISEMENDPGFGRRVVETLAAGGPMRRSIPALPVDLMAALFAFAAREFSWREGERPGEDVDSWRGAVLSRIRDAGTEDAVDHLERLKHEFPQLAWLARVSEEGAERALAAQWNPPTPQEIINLAATRSQRYVGSGDQLLEVITEELELVQRAFDTDPGTATDLWDQQPDGSYKPKSEPQLSNWLKRRLIARLEEGRGIIVNREVEILPRPDAYLGGRTDIHVQAVARPGAAAAELLTTIVEVKGCWNPDVETALNSQLVDDYLLKTGNRYGIYLVAWFESDHWTEGDNRRAVCGRRDKESVMRSLVERGVELEAKHGILLRVVALDIRLDAS